jgi:predicted Zn-dependent peptidase
LRDPLRESDSKAERVQSLVVEKVESLLRYPAERRKEARHEAFSKLRPHVEAELEALETLEWLRDLTDEELDQRKQSAMTFASERIERNNRLSAQLYPKHEVELDGTFIDHLVTAIRASSPSERQQALDKAIEASENARDGVLYEL